MLKTETNVLIVDDDPSIGKAIEATLIRSGYNAKWVEAADNARQILRHTYYEVLIIDCMMPSISGVDFAQEMRRIYGEDFTLILASGIFRDPQFIKQATRKTKAAGFLTKPIDISQLVSIVEKNSAKPTTAETTEGSLSQILLNPHLTDKKRKATLEKLGNIHGFELPGIYWLLASSNLSGQLKLEYSDGETSSIEFNKGAISNVNVKDSDSYFGVLLIENGFCGPDEVQAGLAHSNNKPLGEKLVSFNMLSPHTIFLIQLEQMSIRISKTIRGTNVNIHFEEHQNESNEVIIDRNRIQTLLHDWVSNKISSDWLNTSYVQWMDYSLEMGPNFNSIQKIMDLPLITHIEKVLPRLASSSSVHDIIDQFSNDHADDCLKAIHFLLLSDFIKLKALGKSSVNFDAKIRRLEKMLNEIEHQSHFEILGVSHGADSKTIQKSYHELAKVLHPDKIEAGAPKNLKDLAQKTFGKITGAHEVLISEEKRQNYIDTLAHGNAQEALEAESLFERGYLKLRQGRYPAALKIFQAVKKKKGAIKDLGSFLLWAEMKQGPHVTRQPGFAQKIKMGFNKIPSDERHSPIYFFTKGLYCVITKDLSKAYSFFENALSLQADFMQAQRELNELARRGIRSNMSSEEDSSMRAVTAIMQGFFGIKKKKSS